jgi:hypothetical protein
VLVKRAVVMMQNHYRRRLLLNGGRFMERDFERHRHARKRHVAETAWFKLATCG